MIQERNEMEAILDDLASRHPGFRDGHAIETSLRPLSVGGEMLVVITATDLKTGVVLGDYVSESDLKEKIVYSPPNSQGSATIDS